MAIQLDRPGSVTSAVVLLYLSLAAGAIRAVVSAEAMLEAFGIPMFMGVMLPVLGLLWLLVYLIATGRNWARILYLAMTMIGLPIYLVGAMEQIMDGTVDFLGLGQTILQALAAGLLFLTNSSVWYRAMKAERIAELNALTAQALESRARLARPRAAAIRVQSRPASAPPPDPGSESATCPHCGKPVVLPDAPGTYACPHCGKGISFE